MERFGMKKTAALVLVCMFAITSAPLVAEGSDAAYELGSMYNPYEGYTGTVSSGGTVYIYYGTEVDITFAVDGSYDDVTVNAKSVNCPLEVDGLRVYGTMTMYSASFDVIGTKNGSESTLYSLVISTRILNKADDATVGSYYEYDLFGGKYSSYTISGGQLPAGLSLDSDGYVRGTPTEAGTFYFTASYKNAQRLLASYYRITVEAVGTTTETSVSTQYVVEGSSFSFEVYGTADNGADYQATVTATGGTVTPSAVGDGDIVKYTAPNVSGKTSFTITVTSDVDGCQQSQAEITVWVVDKLAVSQPSVGTISSS